MSVKGKAKIENRRLAAPNHDHNMEVKYRQKRASAHNKLELIWNVIGNLTLYNIYLFILLGPIEMNKYEYLND